jgi:hypothetical protein
MARTSCLAVPRRPSPARALLVGLLGAMLAGCASGSVSGGGSPSGAPIVISEEVWALYQQYVGEGMPGAFAVSRDGRRGNYVYCTGPATAARPCQSAMVSQSALVHCGDDCIVFAEGASIIVPYRVGSSCGDSCGELPRAGQEVPSNEPKTRQ